MSTRTMRRAMAPPARIEHALTSSGVTPTWGPIIVVAAQSAAVISALRTVDRLSPLNTATRCMSGGVLCCRKCATRCRMADTAHAWGCPVASYPIDSSLAPFFLRSKEEANEGGGGEGGRGGFGGLGGLGSHE